MAILGNTSKRTRIFKIYPKPEEIMERVNVIKSSMFQSTGHSYTFSKGYRMFGRISRKINPEEILQTEMLKADPQLSSTNKLLAEMWGKVKTTSGPSTVARGPSAAV